MKRLLLFCAVAFVLFVAMRTEPPMPLAIRVEVAPSTRDEYQLLRRASPFTYTARASVMDPAQPVMYAGVNLVVAPGERETVTQKGERMNVTFTVAVSKNADRAATEVVVKHGEQLLHVQKSDIALRAPSKP